MKKYLWTELRARLQCIRSTQGENFNWLFLPGGPGLGSESLSGLIRLLQLPGTMWYLDLPGDGSNVDDNGSFANWQGALIQAVESLDNVIVVAHSMGGMYVLATPELREKLLGLVLMDSAPDASWQKIFAQFVQNNPLSDVERCQRLYSEHPSGETLRDLTIASVPYLSKDSHRREKFSFLEFLPYNLKAVEWSSAHFDGTYKAKWIPRNIPTLICAGDQDCITPMHLFMDSEEFHHENILIRTIKNAGHFPWIENPEEVIAVFQEYYKSICL